MTEDHGPANMLTAIKLTAAMSNIKRLDLRAALELIELLDQLRARAVEHATMLQGESLPPGRA